MIRTRQRAKLEAAQEIEILQQQSKSIEEDLSEDESNSEDSEEELSEKENTSDDGGGEFSEEEATSDDSGAGDQEEKEITSDVEEQRQGRREQADGECDGLPDILSLERGSESRKTMAIPPKKTKKRVETGELLSSLDPGTEMRGQLYFSFDVESVLSGRSKGRPPVPLDQSGRGPHHDLMKKSVITSDFEKRESAPPISQSRYAIERMKKAERERSAGGKWFDMPAPQLTDELKNDLRLLRMRNALDPTRHYKSSDSKTLPRYFQVGRVVSGPADFYSGRLPGKQRKTTLLDELLAGEESRQYHKKKYLELQNKFMSGTKRLRNIKHKKKFKTSS